MRVSAFLLFTLLLKTTSIHSQEAPEPAAVEPVRTVGTLIGAYGNANGIVVVTDSMLTGITRSGAHVQAPFPGQKLLRLDDQTVCAVAGINQVNVAAFPTLDGDVLGLIEDYRKQLPKRKSFVQTLQDIGGLLKFYLAETATIQLETKQVKKFEPFDLQLLLVGYDTDGQPKIGSLVISVVPGTGSGRLEILPKVVEFSPTPIGGEFTYKTHGLDDIAQRILGDPTKVEGYSILEKYSSARASEDCGASLSISDIEEIGRTVLTITSMTYRREVGLNKQVAVFKNGSIATPLDQPRFSDLRKPLPLFVLQDVNLNSVGGDQTLIFFEPGGVKFYDSASFASPPPRFPDPRNFVQLDNSIFVGCHFTNQLLYYDGGPLYFDETNVLENTQIMFGPKAAQRPELVRMLHDKSWASLSPKN
jgi:hypothetical protein